MKHLLDYMITHELNDYTLICPECRKWFGVTEREQIEGCRDGDYIVCPYCGWINKNKSMRVEYECYKMDEVND